uniref:Uncharacterized protein n=1 Tax=Vitis vinifera TaxID=29760 RepID=A5C3P2_VITVI|nr:hypothetical protein VITISV_010407 [Vitis vinifera]
MAQTRGASPAPSPRCTTRQKPSSAQVPSDSLSLATEAPRIPHSEGGEAIGPFSPIFQRRYETRRPPTTPWATTSCPESSVRCPSTKRAKTSGPGESFRAFEPSADSELPSDMSPESIIRRLMRYHLEHLMTPREFFYPRVALDFYLSMTTHGVRSPTAIHFSIDGHPSVLEARHIAEALQISYEPEDPYVFHQWSLVSQRDMVHILSKETSTDSVFLRKELLPGMLLIDVSMRELLAETTPPVPTLKATSAAPPTTSTIPLVIPNTSESSITISASEFRALVHTFQTLTTTHSALFQKMAEMHAHQD